LIQSSSYIGLDIYLRTVSQQAATTVPALRT
jgi:hypothetical protein